MISNDELREMADADAPNGSFDGLLADLAAELLTARAKIAAAEKLAKAVKAAIKGEAEAEITDAMADAVDAAISAWEQAQ